MKQVEAKIAGGALKALNAGPLVIHLTKGARTAAIEYIAAVYRELLEDIITYALVV